MEKVKAGGIVPDIEDRELDVHTERKECPLCNKWLIGVDEEICDRCYREEII